MASPAAAMKPVATTDGPRKRRRRAPTTGATEDCFACRKRQVKCDRRRPYCTQCIEQGKDCSGYKTTLTWGVGVASRGKLRGLSLPIAKKTSPTSTPTSTPMDTKTAPTATKKPAAKASAQARGLTIDTRPIPTSIPTSAPNSAPPFQPQYNFVNSNPSPTQPIPIPTSAGPQQGWQVPGFSAHLASYSPSHEIPKRRHQLSHPSLHNLHTSFSPAFDDAPLSASTGSFSTYTDSNFGSPIDYPHTPSEMSFSDPLLNVPANAFGGPPSSVDSNDSIPFSNAAPISYAEQLGAAASQMSTAQGFPDMQSGPVGAASLSDPFFTGELNSMQLSTDGLTPGFLGPNVDDNQKQEDGVIFPENSMSMIPRASFPMNFFQISPRTSFLLDYYDKHICSVLVAFDGPDNPYRSHVLHLAMANEGLQNAISALVVNNIRIRGGSESRLLQQGPAYSPVDETSKSAAEDNRKSHGEPTPEELHYKAASINMLNAQLAHPSKAKDDSVLATLLILCLFHVSDSGFSKFKTQLAGVQKLLRMRESGLQSSFIGWIEMFFAWFDVMTSTVNDREVQIQSSSLDMLDFNQNLGSLEHLSGCEGRLFKLIARLGRLNLLGQRRSVRKEEQFERTPRASATPTPQPLKNERTDYYSLNLFDRLDGNGWGTPLASPGELPGSTPPTASLFPDSPIRDTKSPTSHAHPDNRHEFWREWYDIRSRLRSWTLDSTTIPAADAAPSPDPTSPSSSPKPSPSQQALHHINSSFQLAALLYTERLAYPNLPSSSSNIANLVNSALAHMQHIGVDSCVLKFLLWPLFIVGTECVNEEQRALVRERCVLIQRESGFFNNLSGLEVLERVWREDDAVLEAEADGLVGGLGPKSDVMGGFGLGGGFGSDGAIGLGGIGMKTGGVEGQAFKWRKAMDRIDGEYIII
ncbi:MAG: hypothetical protein M1820_008152 [Bogoriella megaspora]|nr:MAG: hypothetical protein M1820_008152 [Bogoriella megaspora]